MERDAEPRRVRPRGTQQRRRVVGVGAEFSATGRARRRPSAARGARPGRASPRTPVAVDSVEDLRQLAGTVEHEVAHAMARPRLADRAARLDRVHEVDRPRRGTSAAPARPRRSRRSRNGARRRAHSARSTAGSGLHFTAYSTSPGKAATKSRAVAVSTSLGGCSAPAPRAAARRPARRPSGRRGPDAVIAGGGGAERRRNGHAGWTSRQSSRQRTARASRDAPWTIGETGKTRRRARRAPATGSGDAGGLRIAANRSAQHRQLPNDPGPRWPDRRKGRLRRCCAPGFRGSRHVRCVRRSASPWGKAEARLYANGGRECICEYCGMRQALSAWSGSGTTSARYSHTIVAAASAVISATS